MTAVMDKLGRERARILAGLLALAGMAALYAATAKRVTLVVEGDPHEITTHARTVEGVLRDAGWAFGAGDLLEPGLHAPVHDGDIVRLDVARAVQIEGPSGTVQLVTAEDVPADILATAGLRLFPGDRVWADGLPLELPANVSTSSPSRLTLITGREVVINDGGERRTIRTAAPTVAEALWEAGIRLFEGDLVVPAPADPLEGIASITITRSHPLIIHVDGESLATRAIGESVGQALTEAGVPLIGLDFTRPALDEDLPADGNIRVVRVEERVEVEEKPIPFETTYQPVDDLEIDNQRVIENGAYGVMANRVRVRLEDGQETQRFVESDWVARQPEPRVIGYGTQIIPRTTNTDDGPIQYCRAVSMYATSYSPSRAGVPAGAKNFGITASGKPLTRGLVAIDRSLIPFGTLMYVPGYGFAEAADTGGGVKGRWIDLGYDDDNYVAWHQYVTVYFLCPLPGLAWIFP